MELSEIREKINSLDDRLLELFLQRMDLAEEVAAYKSAHNQPILNKAREQEILARVTEQAGERGQYAHRLFTTLFELSRSRQAELLCAPTRVGAQVRAALENGNPLFPQTGSVAYRSEEGGNAQTVCSRLFPHGQLVCVRTFSDVVSSVATGLCDFGVLPTEDGANGSARAVYDLLQEHSLSIVRSTRLCPRFICIAKNPVIYDGSNRIGLIVSTDNPGNFFDILARPAALGINMTHLESCPAADRKSGLVFSLELEASVQDPGVLAMLEELERNCSTFHYLGSYTEI